MKDRYEERDRLERAILSALFMNYEELIDYLDIPYTDFTKQNWQILKLIKSEWTSDPIVLSNKSSDISIEELRDVSTELISCGVDEFKEYVSTLKELITRERLTYNLTTTLAKVKDWVSLEKIYADINDIKMEWGTLTDDTEIALEILKEINWESEVKIIKTWYSELDKLIGWYEKCQVVVIWARPWIWKSMFAINLANNNLLAWEKVALFSLEMDKKQVFRRLVAMNSWVWVRKLKEKNEWESRVKAWKWVEMLLEQLKSFYCFDDVHSIDELERKIRFLVHKEWVNIFYLDYLQLLRNPSVKNNPVESITDMSQRLKQLALELKITIIELSQLNRESDKTAVKRASQLRGSGSIEQDADMIWILDKAEETWDRITVSVQKCRDWRIWDVDLIQISDIMRIVDLPSKPF